MIFLGESALNEAQRKALGGKASQLHLLKSEEFNVPQGFVLMEESQNLSEAVRKIGGFPVAVRSSCSMEDMADASFAGLYETFLNVESLQDLELKVKLCFESASSERVMDYLNTKGITYHPDSLKMSVLIQKMVDPLIAGVLFTLNPMNGFEEEYYLEYCLGLGERLVSGLVTPTTCRFDKRSLEKISELINEEGASLKDSILLKLIEESKKIQAYFGYPQDIEWAIDKNNELFILQSRPITSFSPREDVPELTNADLKDGGISARVCTPFMFSAYRNALEFSMGDYFKKISLIHNSEDIQWIFYYYGRVFWNAGAVKEGLKKLPDYNEESLDRDLGIQKNYGPSGPQMTKMSLASLIEAIPVLMGLNREFSDCEVMVDQFRDQFANQDRVLKKQVHHLKLLDEEHFRAWLLDALLFQRKTERSYFRTIYNNSNYQSEFKSGLKKMKGYQEGDEIDLMGSLSGVAHLDVQADLDILARSVVQFGLGSEEYVMAREKFLESHYHHGPAELDITVPRWGEKKSWVDDLVKAHASSSRSNSFVFENTVERLLENEGYFGKWKFKGKLERSRHFLKIREEMRSYSTRAYYLIRLGMLEFGQRYKVSYRELFMLDINDVLSFLQHSKVLPDLKERLLSYEGYRHFSPPNEFGGSIVQVTHSHEGHLKGIGCSPGEITGRARVILDIHQTLLLTKDDILITVFTDPGWTPVLARVGGVITEVGGLLSHAAVIGREYGIPAILNLIQATRVIPDGVLIRMNGKTGVVEILEESP